eukprot:4120079-Prymnesium_polylepis.1
MRRPTHADPPRPRARDVLLVCIIESLARSLRSNLARSGGSGSGPRTRRAREARPRARGVFSRVRCFDFRRVFNITMSVFGTEGVEQRFGALYITHIPCFKCAQTHHTTA